jgi:hypothetical protein
MVKNIAARTSAVLRPMLIIFNARWSEGIIPTKSQIVVAKITVRNIKTSLIYMNTTPRGSQYIEEVSPCQ